MSLRSSDARRTRAEQVPYTPPAARRSAGAPSDHAEGYTAGASPRASQGKTSPCQQKTTSAGDETARRRQAGRTNASTATVAKTSRSSNNPPIRASTQTATTGASAAPAAAAPAAAATKPAVAASEETRAKKGVVRVDELSPPSRGSSTRDPSDHAPPPPPDPKNVPPAAAAAGSRRKPRQAWAQYVPPSRRGGREASSPDAASPPASALASASKTGGGSHSPSAAADLGAAAAGGDSRGGKFSPSRGVENRPASKAIPPHRRTEVAPERAAAADDEGGVSEENSRPEERKKPGEETARSLPLSDAEGDDTNEKVHSPPLQSEARCSPPADSSDGSSIGTSPKLTASPTAGVPNEKRQDGEPLPTTPPPAPTSEAPSDEHQGDVPLPPDAIPASGTSPDATDVDVPPEGPMGEDNDPKAQSNGDGNDRDKGPELPALKPPSARYIPPGRRKALDTEAAAAAASGRDLNGGGGGAAGDGMGPLWASRAPVRVSQRERPSDRDAEAAARPNPSRVAGVVSGGMSAYGANISEYSEEMSREQVEACTAVVSNFPMALPPGQRDTMLQSFVALGGLVVWPRPDEALVTFATPALARQAISGRNNRSTVLVVELLSQTRGDRRAAYRRVELARPGRPPADVSSGSRLILGALGIRRPKSKPSGAAAATRKSAASKGGVRGRGAKNAQAPPAESTDSWDM